MYDVTRSFLHYLKMPQLCNEIIPEYLSEKDAILRKSMPPRTHILHTSQVFHTGHLGTGTETDREYTVAGPGVHGVAAG